jgi:hypothetical protein|uniref:Uncharacterized protein n=1 Tax=viral metagenome TaxID=1070528 RepID=A0A6C0BJD5_9ZZZZ
MFNFPAIFDCWTTNTIPKLLVVIFGYDGLERRIYAIQLLKQFHCWYRAYRPDGYRPPHQDHAMYTISQIEFMIHQGQQFDEALITSDPVRNQRQALARLHAFWDQMTHRKAPRWWNVLFFTSYLLIFL